LELSSQYSSYSLIEVLELCSQYNELLVLFTYLELSSQISIFICNIVELNSHTLFRSLFKDSLRLALYHVNKVEQTNIEVKSNNAKEQPRRLDKIKKRS
jgi:hypothetical protein